MVDISSWVGKKNLVIYFYPKDESPGCTKEACYFRDDYHVYTDNNVVILGVSPDTSEEHAKFKSKYNLPFTLLADEGHQIAETYGVWGRKKNYGREYDGIFRTTFLIGPDGKIVRVFENVRPSEHSAEVLDAFKISS